MKKTWQKPQLLILTRSKPEEAVLLACKYFLILTGETGSNGNCERTVADNCYEVCSDIGSS